MRGAFSGALGPEMKAKAKQWAAETPDMDELPEHKGMMARVKKSKKAGGLFERARG